MDCAVKSVIYALVLISFAVYSLEKHSPDISSGAYVGCFRMFRESGAHTTFGKRVNQTKREPTSCREKCRNENFTYVGLVLGGNCLCASVLPVRTTLNSTSVSGLIIERVNDSQCNASCADNSTLSCGGFGDVFNAIYSVYSVCPKAMFSSNQCKRSCHCKDGNHCSVDGKCPGFECAPGWRLNATDSNACSIDIDECQVPCSSTRTSQCNKCNSRPNERCRNTRGWYECICINGYKREDGNGSCKDIDECAEGTSHCKQNCCNTIGNYTCGGCNSGYQPQDSCNANSSVLTAVGFALLSIIIAILLIVNVIQWRRSKQLTRNKGEGIIPDTYTALRIQETIDEQDPYTELIAPVNSPEATDAYQNVQDLN